MYYMITINVSFDGEEEEKLRKLKSDSGLSWEEFILVSSGVIRKSELWKRKAKRWLRLINNYEVLKQKLAECEKRIKELETENAKLKEENEDLEWSEIEARMGDDFWWIKQLRSWKTPYQSNIDKT